MYVSMKRSENHTWIGSSKLIESVDDNFFLRWQFQQVLHENF